MRLLVIDGDHTVHRYGHAFGPDGPEASFGFALGRYRRSIEPTHAVMVFDNGKPTWRHDEFPTYKANRSEPAETVSRLFAVARSICEGWRLPHATAPAGVEGDDLIASYVEAAVARGWSVSIVSGDKDLTQLVRPHPTRVWMVDEVRKITWTPAEVVAKFGVGPEHVAGYLALMGDSSDGYAGVPGIGKKTAAALIREFGSFDRLMARRNLVTQNATYKRLREHADAAMACYRLASLVRDVPLPVPLERLAWGIGRGRDRSVRA